MPYVIVEKLDFQNRDGTLLRTSVETLEKIELFGLKNGFKGQCWRKINLFINNN